MPLNMFYKLTLLISPTKSWIPHNAMIRRRGKLTVVHWIDSIIFLFSMSYPCQAWSSRCSTVSPFLIYLIDICIEYMFERDFISFQYILMLSFSCLGFVVFWCCHAFIFVFLIVFDWFGQSLHLDFEWGRRCCSSPNLKSAQDRRLKCFLRPWLLRTRASYMTVYIYHLTVHWLWCSRWMWGQGRWKGKRNPIQKWLCTWCQGQRQSQGQQGQTHTAHLCTCKDIARVSLRVVG